MRSDPSALRSSSQPALVQPLPYSLEVFEDLERAVSELEESILELEIVLEPITLSVELLPPKN